MNNINMINIRQKFLDFFTKNHHVQLNSSPVIPKNDQTLLFTNAGMVQFKKIFLALEEPKYKSIATAQKCIRAGGKHNDLENVGHTNRHHTFFEMLGNFSFGEYFKEKAIELAWKFITEEICLDTAKIYITIHSDDDEAFAIWKKVTNFPDEKIIRLDENFWSMGDAGPCGPCSEIFYDKGDGYFGSLPGQGTEEEQNGDRYLEIWNLVFMSFNKEKDQPIKELRTKCIDTGMGLERITAILEEKDSAYETTIFRPIIDKIEEITKKSYSEHKSQFRIIADHLRSSCFLIAESITPSNEGRGYVLRRIMRRAFQNVYELGYDNCLLDELFAVLEKSMSYLYQELTIEKENILQSLRNEYAKFSHVLEKGHAIIEERLEYCKKNNIEFSEKDAFFLYESHGMPFDMTNSIIAKISSTPIKLSHEKFEREFNLHREKAKNSWKGHKEDVVSQIMSDISSKIKIKTTFIGYDESQLQCSANIIAIEVIEDRVLIITDRTPFYATGGGQIGDSGTIKIDSGMSKIAFQVNITENVNNVYFHICDKPKIDNVMSLDFFDNFTNKIANMKIDEKKRYAISANHSATHIMHAALRSIFGNHITQKGSFINDEKFTFDFNYDAQLTQDEVTKIENIVNRTIRENHEMHRTTDTPENAIKNGVVGTFEDKYADEIFVIEIGISKAICGGTHVKRSGDIGMFKILNQSSSGSGIRRIEAITGAKCEEYMQNLHQIAINASSLLNVKNEEIISKIEKIIKENKALKVSMTANVEFSSEMINDVEILSTFEQKISAIEIRKIIQDEMSKNQKSPKIIIGVGFDNPDSDKGTCVIAITNAAINSLSHLSAKEIIQKICNGGGGNHAIAQSSCGRNVTSNKAKEIIRGIIVK